MSTMPISPPTLAADSTGRARRACRAAGDRGVALVEFAFVFVLFFTLIIGIVVYGVTLSFQQTMTQAANEAARAAAVTADNPLTTTPAQAGGVSADERINAAWASINKFNSWGRPCTANGMSCTVVPRDCNGTINDPAVLPDCVVVTMTYDYGNFPILPAFPLISALLPQTLRANATAQISDEG